MQCSRSRLYYLEKSYSLNCDNGLKFFLFGIVVELKFAVRIVEKLHGLLRSVCTQGSRFSVFSFHGAHWPNREITPTK